LTLRYPGGTLCTIKIWKQKSKTLGKDPARVLCLPGGRAFYKVGAVFRAPFDAETASLLVKVMELLVHEPALETPPAIDSVKDREKDTQT
jgi:hypothetical protein